MGCTILVSRIVFFRKKSKWLAPLWAPESLFVLWNSFGCIILGSRIIAVLKEIICVAPLLGSRIITFPTEIHMGCTNLGSRIIAFLRNSFGCIIVGSRIIAFLEEFIWVAPFGDPETCFLHKGFIWWHHSGLQDHRIAEGIYIGCINRGSRDALPRLPHSPRKEWPNKLNNEPSFLAHAPPPATWPGGACARKRGLVFAFAFDMFFALFRGFRIIAFPR